MIDINKIARPCISDIPDYVPGTPIEEVKRELGLNDVIKLSSNENPLGTSPFAVKAMAKELNENVHFYPESLCPLLTEKLAQIYHLEPGQFFVNNGVDGVLSMIGAAFINPGDEVITSQYSFGAYQSVTGRMNGKAIIIPQTSDRRFNINGIIAAITPKTKIIFLCNPNNPSGTITTQEEFDRLMDAVAENTLLVSDEAYYDFVDDPQYPQTIPYLAKHPNLIITRTFSKVMGLAGVRIGYCIAHPEIIKMLRKVCDPFPVNRLAQAGALASLDDVEFMRSSIKLVREGREQLYRGMTAMGLEPIPSQTNFILVDLGIPSTPIYQKMLHEGVIIRPLAPQGMPTCLRFTIGTQEQNDRALKALAKALND